MASFLDQIGNTPLVKLNRILPDVAAQQTNILAKLEFQVLICVSRIFEFLL
jgi:cysteine synthase